MARIEDLPLATPVYNDIDLFADISDSNNAKSNTIGSKVKAGLADPTVTADDLQDGATKKVLTAIERTKLSGIQAGSQVNTVTSVNGQMGVVVLDADDIADTATRKMGNEIFNTSEKNKLDTAYTHSQAVTGNPHNVTAAQVGLGNVANERQLSRTAGNFNALPLKTDIQRNMNDLVPIQDVFDNDIIKKVTVGTQYIRYSSTIQLWRPSVNYHADTLVNSTTYEIRNIVIDEVTGGMYYCTISHQSGANFASDLALGYWTPVLAGGGGSSPVYVIRGASNPTQAIPGGPRTPSGAFAGQLFANTVTADILVRDGNDRVLNSAGGGGSGVTITVGVGAPVGSGTNPGDMYIDYNTANIYVWNGTSWVVNNATGGSGSGIIYSLANGTVVASTTGNRGLASTGIGADKTYETSQEIDPLTGNTINMNFGPGGTVVFDDTDINFENGTTLNYDSTVVSNHNGDTVNYDGSTINSENTEYNHTGDTINYDATTTVDGGIFNNITINNPTITGTSSQSDWQQSNNTLPDFIKNKVVRPDQLGGTTTNGKGVVRDTNGTFRDLSTSDITALGFVAGSSGGPVDGLDGIVFRADNTTGYRANYRGDTLGSRSSGGKGVWYDNTNKTIIVSQDNVVKKYNTQGTEIGSVTTSGGGDILKGSNLTKVVFTRNGCQKIDLNTFTLGGTVGGTLLDISPDGTIGCSITNNQFNTGGIESFTITSFNTSNLSIINTYTYQHLNGFGNNIFVGATLINNTDMVVYYGDGGNGSIAYVLRKVNINTNATITSAGVGAVNDQGYAIQYSTSDSKIYYSRDIFTGFASRPTLYSISTNLTSNTAVSNSLMVSERLYRCSDGSMGYDRGDSGTTRYGQLFINLQNKFWNSIGGRDELVSPGNRSQLTPIY